MGASLRFCKCPQRTIFRLRCLLPLVLLVIFVAPANAQGLSFGDMDARPAPDWLSKASIYEVWLNVFSKEGNLRGAIPRLQQIAELGAKIVYLGPIAKRSAVQTSPYSIADYNEIDPACGTPQDLRDFVAEAHRLHLKVMLDIVYYHAAPDNVMMSRDPSLFVHNSDGKIVRGFWPQPLPDFHKPEVRRYLIDSLIHWVRDFDVDGFRCDVGGGVPVSFWNDARKALDQVRPGIILLSESDRPDDQLQAFDINYNFQYYLALRSVLRDGAPAIRLREVWEQMRATMPKGARLLHYSDNHDWPRAVVQFGERGAIAASVLNFTLDGVPFLYNGQEVNDPSPISWRRLAPIHWPDTDRIGNEDSPGATLALYKKLFRLRASEPAIYSGSVVWVNNSEPDSVLSFLRKYGDSEVLVVVNLSNRDVSVTLDLPVMDNYVVENLIEPGKTWFQLYSGRVSAKLGAFGYIVGRKIPLGTLEQRGK
jgi:glycosidase